MEYSTTFLFSCESQKEFLDVGKKYLEPTVEYNADKFENLIKNVKLFSPYYSFNDFEPFDSITTKTKLSYIKFYFDNINDKFFFDTFICTIEKMKDECKSINCLEILHKTDEFSPISIFLIHNSHMCNRPISKKKKVTDYTKRDSVFLENGYQLIYISDKYLSDHYWNSKKYHQRVDYDFDFHEYYKEELSKYFDINRLAMYGHSWGKNSNLLFTECPNVSLTFKTKKDRRNFIDSMYNKDIDYEKISIPYKEIELNISGENSIIIMLTTF